MKHTCLKSVISALVIGFSGVCLANQVLIKNASENGKPLTVTYQIAHKNRGEATVFSAIKTINVTDTASVSFDPANYELAGIIALAVNGHSLPQAVTQFDKPKQCAITMDKTHTEGELQFIYKDLPGGHGQIGCSAQGGIYS